MPNIRKEPSPISGSQRAAEVNDSFLHIPGYADDSMLSVVRYVSTVQASLRKCDYDEFMAELGAADKAAKDPSQGPAARVQKIKEHRQKALDKLEGFPELEAGFDGFIASAKSLRRQQEVSTSKGSSSEEKDSDS
ncbi:hypothetical protein LIA77_00599 [Sarocladium implicatum]|nr:hypothetical protein LIA77_00599 [Sarocladium implicatum]